MRTQFVFFQNRKHKATVSPNVIFEENTGEKK